MAAQEPREIALEADKKRVRKCILRLERINTKLRELNAAKTLVNSSIKVNEVPITFKKRFSGSDLDVITNVSAGEVDFPFMDVSFVFLSSIPDLLHNMIINTFEHSKPLNEYNKSLSFQVKSRDLDVHSIDFIEAVLQAYETHYNLISDPEEGLATKVAASVCSFFNIKPELPDLSWLPYEFSHFLRAQNGKETGYFGYNTARNELNNGKKKSHWIWYIFPQIQGLGNSLESKKYAIQDLSQACRYLQHPTLFERYNALIEIVKEKLESANSLSLRDLFGTDIDAKKFISSITLFECALKELLTTQKNEAHERLLNTITVIFNRAAQAKYYPCESTLEKLKPQAASSSNFFSKSSSAASSSSSSVNLSASSTNGLIPKQ